MKKETWNDGLSQIDSELIEEYYLIKKKYQKKRRRKDIFARLAAATVCLSLIVTAGATLVLRKTHESGTASGVASKPAVSESLESDEQYVPNADEIRLFSADEIAKMYKNETLSTVATNRYTEVCVAGDEFLDINDIPQKEYLEIYSIGEDLPLNEEEFEEFYDKMLPALKSAIKEKTWNLKSHLSEYSISSDGETDTNHVSFWQNARVFGVGIYSSYYSKNDDLPKTYIYGEQIMIDQSLSDEEIIESIGTIKANLFKMFDTSFTDVKIIRLFNDNYLSRGLIAKEITVYFYNEADHPMNPYLPGPLSDYISLRFGNLPSFTHDVVSDSVLEVVDITYQKKREDPRELYSVSSYSPMISLEEAEALLEKGYVFGGHSCPICMANQERAVALSKIYTRYRIHCFKVKLYLVVFFLSVTTTSLFTFLILYIRR